MTYLFYDVETNGLPKDWKAPVGKLDNWPRVIQIAFSFWHSTNPSDPLQVRQAYAKKYLIKPDGWTIPKEKFWIENGYSTEQNEAEGVPLKEVLYEFLHYHVQSEYMIAHNQAFDRNVVGAEMIRLGLSSARRPTPICTMKAATAFCALPRNKWPKLEELHQKLFGCKFDDAHDALADIEATARCFFELARRKVIPLP